MLWIGPSATQRGCPSLERARSLLMRGRFLNYPASVRGFYSIKRDCLARMCFPPGKANYKRSFDTSWRIDAGLKSRVPICAANCLRFLGQLLPSNSPWPSRRHWSGWDLQSPVICALWRAREHLG
jgi:hypothetical protein